MKRFFSLVLAAVLLVVLLPFKTYAVVNSQVDEDVVYFEDGSYITIELSWTETRASGTKTGSKT